LKFVVDKDVAAFIVGVLEEKGARVEISPSVEPRPSLDLSQNVLEHDVCIKSEIGKYLPFSDDLEVCNSPGAIEVLGMLERAHTR
jgi:hypothetical protein